MPGPTLVPNLWLCCTSSGPSMAGGSIPERFRPRRWGGDCTGTGRGPGGDRTGRGRGRACQGRGVCACTWARPRVSTRACA